MTKVRHCTTIINTTTEQHTVLRLAYIVLHLVICALPFNQPLDAALWSQVIVNLTKKV